MRSLVGTLLWLLAPVVLSAQSAGLGSDPADVWRANLNGRLDRDIAQLTAGPQLARPVAPKVGRDDRDGAVPRFVSFPKVRGPEDPAWLPAIAGVFRSQGLPAELVGIAAVESKFDPDALSSKGARGLWQLMPETARRYGLVVNTSRDERTDPLKSTIAAAQYLKALYAQFRDWPLVLAAYNSGEGRLQQSLERVRARDFWTLSRNLALPDETRRYVPAVLARLGISPRSLSLPLAPTQASPSHEPQLLAPSRGSLTQTQVVFAMTSPRFDTSANTE